MNTSVLSRAIPGTKYGQWAVVTGASDGIGKAFAELLAQSGFNLVIAARREDVLANLARHLSGLHGIAVRPVACDLGKPEGVALLEEVTEALDAGLLVAAAGFGTSGPFLRSDLTTELGMIDVNCRAVAALAHAFGNRFARRGGGGIVLLSSLVAFQGVPCAANYAATKAYVQTFAEGLRRELADAGVDVLAVAPGPVRSGFGQRKYADGHGPDTRRGRPRGAASAREPRDGATRVPGAVSGALTQAVAALGPRPCHGARHERHDETPASRGWFMRNALQ